jgi:tetratricopeptide (TPR) repeat protein
MNALGHGDVGSARSLASDWHDKDPGDVLGLVALGETLEASKDLDRAARAYGSIIDLFPARADLRRFAGGRLEHLAGGTGLDVAIDTYTKANDERPDHPSSHRFLAFALLKKGLYEKAFDAAVAGLTQHYPAGRFAGADRVLREDLGLIGAAWAKADPKRRGEIQKRVTDMGGTLENEPSLRFVLTWETDANDVDFHIFDAKGGHAFYSSPNLASGGSLYADVTTGYGPECFTIRGPKAKRAGPYTLQANYYSRGPMGYGMGKLEIIDHDGAGNLSFDERPYVVMVDHAFVDLGVAR